MGIPLGVLTARQLTEHQPSSFAAANQVVTLTGVTYVTAPSNWVGLLQVSSVQFNLASLKSLSRDGTGTLKMRDMKMRETQ